MKTLRVAICVMLIVGVLAMSLSVFAVDEPEPTPTWYPGTEDHPLMTFNLDQVAFLVWTLLDSWGIEVTYQDVAQYTTPVQMEIMNWIYEYIDDQPSIETVSSWILDWWMGTDFWGNLVVNDTLLEDVEAFAGWLESKLGLIDNSTHVVNPTYTYGSYNLYRTNTWYSATPYGNATPSLGEYGMFKVETVGNFLWMPVILTNGIGYIFFDESSFSSVRFGNLTSDDTVNNNTSTTFYCSSFGVNQDGWYYGANEYTINSNASWLPTGGNYYNSDSTWQNWRLDSSDIMRYIQVSHIVEEGDVAVITTLISLPANNPDYVNGDGLTIVDGTPQYGHVVIPDSVSVDNLPAIITQNKIPDIGNDTENPGFSVPWQAVNGLIQYVAAPAGAIMALVNEAPVEGVIMLYALIGGMIIFGMIRIMREH